MDEKEMKKNIGSFGLEKLITEFNDVMENARYVCPYPEYAGMVRNDIMKTMTEYMNKSQDTYICERKFKIKYNELER